MAIQDKRNVRSTTIEIDKAYGVIDSVKFIKNSIIEIGIKWYKNKEESDLFLPEICRESITISRDAVEDNNGISTSIDTVLSAIYQIVKSNDNYKNAMDV